MTEFDPLYEAEVLKIKGTLHDHHPLLRDWYLAAWEAGGEEAVKMLTNDLLGQHADWQYALEGG